MKTIAYRTALFGFALVTISLAVALAFAFAALLSQVGPGLLGTEMPGASMTDPHEINTPAVLVDALGVFEGLAQWVVALVVVIGVVVLPMVGLVLLGVGGVCLYDSLAGLPAPTGEASARKEPAVSEDRYPDAKPVFGVLPHLRKLYPTLS